MVSVPRDCAEGNGGFYTLTSGREIGIAEVIYVECGTAEESEGRSESNEPGTLG